MHIGLGAGECILIISILYGYNSYKFLRGQQRPFARLFQPSKLIVSFRTEIKKSNLTQSHKVSNRHPISKCMSCIKC